MKLYTIPYAGGFAFTFQRWKPYLDDGIELIPIEFPGRGENIDVPLCPTIDEMAEYVYRQIIADDVNQYALFGHSMGAYVLLEVYTKLYNRNNLLPKRIIISAMTPPHLHKPKSYHLLDEKTFREKLFELGGIPFEITQDIEFANYLFPILRNDFKAVENYNAGDLKSFTCPVHIFNSESDIHYENVMQWQLYSNHTLNYHKFSGSHFFINEDVKKITSDINGLLSSWKSPIL